MDYKVDIHETSHEFKDTVVVLRITPETILDNTPTIIYAVEYHVSDDVVLFNSLQGYQKWLIEVWDSKWNALRLDISFDEYSDDRIFIQKLTEKGWL